MQLSETVSFWVFMFCTGCWQWSLFKLHRSCSCVHEQGVSVLKLTADSLEAHELLLICKCLYLHAEDLFGKKKRFMCESDQYVCVSDWVLIVCVSVWEYSLNVSEYWLCVSEWVSIHSMCICEWIFTVCQCLRVVKLCLYLCGAEGRKRIHAPVYNCQIKGLIPLLLYSSECLMWVYLCTHCAAQLHFWGFWSTDALFFLPKHNQTVRSCYVDHPCLETGQVSNAYNDKWSWHTDRPHSETCWSCLSGRHTSCPWATAEIHSQSPVRLPGTAFVYFQFCLVGSIFGRCSS